MKYEGELIGKGLRVAIVVARFNEFITKKLVEGAQDMLLRLGVAPSDIELLWVPGSFEIPLITKKIAEQKNVDTIICLGCIIKGDTPHFDLVAGEVAKGIREVMLATGVPIVFGVISADNLEQAIERAGTKMGNKGSESALTAVEMANLIKKIKK
jgi:6,7-dimethyl-8-ribityllumazine synthase